MVYKIMAGIPDKKQEEKLHIPIGNMVILPVSLATSLQRVNSICLARIQITSVNMRREISKQRRAKDWRQINEMLYSAIVTFSSYLELHRSTYNF
ncbi:MULTISPECIES: hypothetical protein [Calothrix]|uniref:Uncharacterized protein n=2 Tax=Calothrix TaxID=1186 RepID=A0ABR8AIX3_9CYAN|nr:MULTISPECIES: hypothetical protein [Calothrix]MBD2200001.1 hypothetical protein [Calothrix parietina FACHB-288]MBD2227279.1 hypothetical protein [Calothrix anomala FACHB-343]